MRIIHTADWHIGQTLNGWSREAEHRTFLGNLGQLIADHQVDVLLVAGDVFDGINPSGDAQRLLYGALADFLRQRPGLTVVMIAGNHDPAGRLEAPGAVLRALGVHVVGTMQRQTGGVDMDRHLIPLRDAAGVTCAHVLAIPFLRASDLPGLTLGAMGGAESAIVTATRALHAQMTDAAIACAGGVPVIAMGHLTCAGGLESEGAERRILIGGEHAVPPDIYPPGLCYVALGHLHRPQSLDGGRVRYSGSPFPLSATEIPYDHGVTLIDLSPGGMTITHLPMARPVDVLRLPAAGALTPAELDAALVDLSLDAGLAPDLQPFVHAVIRAEHAVPVVLAEIEAVLARHPVRLADIHLSRPETTTINEPPPTTLAETSPEVLFLAAFRDTHGIDPDGRHLAAFRDALAEV